MTPTLILLLCTLGQPPVEIPDRVRDLAFSEVVGDLDRVLDPRDARLVRRLCCDRHDCREDASGHLESLGQSAARALIWGTYLRDREAAARCEGLLSRLYACPECAGTGRCPSCRDDVSTYCRRCEYIHLCRSCGGSGDLRLVLSTRDEATSTCSEPHFLARDLFRW